MARLRRSSCAEPGYRRLPRGRGFTFVDPSGTTLKDPAVLARLRGLVVPPAWRDVWLCTAPNGHLQAVGTDAAGRRQYLYHLDWRAGQDRDKFDRILDFARALPAARVRSGESLAADGLGRDRVLAAALRLLDRGLFRVGGETYARDNGSFGLATVRRDQVSVSRSGEMAFCYVGKSGQEWESRVVDPVLGPVVSALRNRRSGGDELLAWRDSPRGRWRDVGSADVNDYVKATVGADYSAKDFRTWHATVLAAVGLGVSAPVTGDSVTARRRAVNRVVREVADQLGNTPAVCRSSYIDPRVIDHFHAGDTVVDVLGDLAAPEPPEGNVVVEAAVLDLLDP